MAEIFQKKIQVMEYECDLQRRIRLSDIMHHAQQMGSEHLATKKVDYVQMYQDGMVFVVNKMNIRIKRRPFFHEKLMLTTIPKEPKGVQFIRDTFFDTENGEHLLEVSISWALINPETRRILRPSVFDRYGFQFSPNDGETITSYKLRRPEGDAVMHQRQVKYSDLDYNGHVNNAVYANIVCDMIPLKWLEKKEIDRFGIIYHKEAKPGQVIDLETVQLERGWYFAGRIAGERCFEAEIFFKNKDE